MSIASNTFYNLSLNRQQEIIQICLEEFTENSYEKASLNHIIKRCNIAKGSFYRYFSTKLDLYCFLIDHCRVYNVEQFNKHILDNPSDLYCSWKKYYKSIMNRRYTEALPFNFLLKAARYRDNPELEALFQTNRRRSITLLTPIFTNMQTQGLIRNDISPERLAYFFLTIQAGLLDQMVNMYSQYTVHTVPEQLIDQELDMIIQLLREGMDQYETNDS